MQKKAIRLITIVVCLVVMVFVASSYTWAGEKKKESVSITYAIWDINQAPGMKAIAAQFEKKNPGIKVKVEVTSWDQYWTKLQAAANGGSLPDIFWMHTGNFLNYASAGMFMDLTNKVAGSSKLKMNQFPKDLVNLYTYNGKILGIPKDYDTIGLWYNKALFDAKGLKYPDATWDWNKLLEAAKQLTDPSKGIYGFAAPVDTQQNLYNFIYQNGGYPVNNTYSKSGYDLDATKEAVEFSKDLSQKYKVSPTPEQFSNTSVAQYFESGKLAMAYFGSWMVSEFAANTYVKSNCDVATIPHGKKKASMYNGLANVAYANSKYPEACWKFLEYTGTKEANDIQSKFGAAIPAYQGAASGWVKHFQNFNVKVYPEMLKIAVLMPTNSPAYESWYTDETDILPQIYTGKLSIDAGCKLLAQKINEDIAAKK